MSEEPFVTNCLATIDAVKAMSSTPVPPVTTWDKVPPVTEFPLPDPITPPLPPAPPTPVDPYPPPP